MAAGLKWLNDASSWELRHALVDRAPGEVARTLVGEAAAHPDAPRLLRALVAGYPREVGSALWGRDDDLARELRERLPAEHVARSLGAVAGERAWSAREAWLERVGGLAGIDDVPTATIACDSVFGLDDPRAWKVRRELRAVAPVAALEATTGVVDERAWKWRRRDLVRAPKTVMRSLSLLDDPRAWELRAQATASEEALDSIVGLDSAPAWELRERWLESWPATVVKSLGPLARTDRGHALVVRALEQHPCDMALWRQVVIRA